MGRTGNMSSQEFHDFANLTQRILWQGVVAVRRARSSIADSRGESARKRGSYWRPGVMIAYSAAVL